MKKIGIALSLIIILLFISACDYKAYTENDKLAKKYDEFHSYPKQTEELCKSGGAEWKQFGSGCHDECIYARWDSKEPIECTDALSFGCDCGPTACWNVPLVNLMTLIS